MQKIARFLSACLVVTLTVPGLVWFYQNHINHGTPAAADSSAASTASDEAAYILDEAALRASIQAILAQNSDLDTGISVTDLQTGKKYHWGETASYTAASIGKLVTATAYLHRVETGQAALDDQVGSLTARTQLTKMIEQSDNTAWEELNDIVTHEGLKAYATSIGMTSYTPDNNIMTSDEVALLLAKLAGQKLLNSEHSKLLLSLMKEASMRSYIVAAIPKGTDVYHKVGYLEDRLHDASIIKRGDRSYVLVIFSKASDTYDFSRGSDFFGRITKATLDAFFL